MYQIDALRNQFQKLSQEFVTQAYHGFGRIMGCEFPSALEAYDRSDVAVMRSR